MVSEGFTWNKASRRSFAAPLIEARIIAFAPIRALGSEGFMARIAATKREWEQLAAAARYNARELAKLRRLSVRQLERDFRREFNRTPQHWLNEQRLKAAQQLLLAGEPVKKVAYELGFKQVSHFCRQFKSQNHQTPTGFAHRDNTTPLSLF